MRSVILNTKLVVRYTVPMGKTFCLARTGLGFEGYSCCLCAEHGQVFRDEYNKLMPRSPVVRNSETLGGLARARSANRQLETDEWWRKVIERSLDEMQYPPTSTSGHSREVLVEEKLDEHIFLAFRHKKH